MFSACDFVMLTCRPDTEAKVSSKEHKEGREVLGDVRNSNKSSANWAHLCVAEPQSTPLIFELERIAIASGSITNANIRGDRGHPCLFGSVYREGRGKWEWKIPNTTYRYAYEFGCKCGGLKANRKGHQPRELRWDNPKAQWLKTRRRQRSLGMNPHWYSKRMRTIST